MNAALRIAIETIIDMVADLEEAKVQYDYWLRQPESDARTANLNMQEGNIRYYLDQIAQFSKYA
jgi:hypothetical protein